MSVDFDVEAAERSIDELITRRSEEREEANEAHAAWRASEVRFLSRRESEIRTEWVKYYRRQAVLFRSLAAENEAKADELLQVARS